MAHRNRRLGMWLVLVLVLVSAAGVTGYQQLHRPAGQAPDFVLMSTGYENGTLGEQVEFRLSDYRGKTVLLDFMAVACTSCRIVEARVLEPIWDERRHDPDFVLISIDTWADPGSGQIFGGETLADLRDFQAAEGHDWRHALDVDDVYLKYGAVTLPKLAVIDPEGRLVLESTGVPRKSTIEDAIDRAASGQAESVEVVRVGLVGLAFLAGVASFFAPCSVGLIPAYMGVLVQGTAKGSAAKRAGRTLWAGGATALGIVTLYAGLAVVFWQVGGFLRPHLTTIQWLTGILLVVLGVTMLQSGLWDRVAKALGMGRIDGRRGFFAFGLGYGLAAFGCTGPIFLPVLFAGFVAGTGLGFAVFGAYAMALALFMLCAAALVASGQTTRLRRMLDNTVRITRISAAFFVVAGLITLWVHHQATGTWGP